MTARILPPTPENIALAAAAIQRGEVVGMPTETVYGLAGDCRNPLAIARIFETKERPTFDPLIVHVGPIARGVEALEQLELIDASQLSSRVYDRVQLLIHHFWPGPLTLVLPKHKNIPDLITSGLPSVALRMPKHPIAQALISASQTSLAAPSANRFGRISPTEAKAVVEELGDRIEFVVDGGPCPIGIESTVIRFDDAGEVWILRHGGTPHEALERVLGGKVHAIDSHQPKEMSKNSDQNSSPQFASPGMLASHYAPKKPLFLLPKPVALLTPSSISDFQNNQLRIASGTPIGLLLIQGDPGQGAQYLSSLFNQASMADFPIIARSLSKQGSLEEAAQNLFAELRSLDSSQASVILAEPCLNPHGLGFAIADRLKRASVR